MSTLTFQGASLNARRMARKRSAYVAARQPAASADSPLPVPLAAAAVGSRRSFTLLGLVLLALLLHAAIFGALSYGPADRLVTPPKVPPIEIQISKPQPLPQAPAPPPPVTPPKKMAPPPLKPTVATRTPSPAPPAIAAASAAVTDNRPAPTEAVAVAAPAVPPAPAAKPERTTQPRGDAAYLNNPPPKYPVMARSRGWEGQVMLNVHVLASGRPDQVEIVQSSGRNTLDEAALKAVREWLFVPAMRGLTAVDGWVQVPIDFKLGK